MNSFDRKGPCYNKGEGCPDRCAGCHGSCKRYKEWSDKRTALLRAYAGVTGMSPAATQAYWKSLKAKKGKSKNYVD